MLRQGNMPVALHRLAISKMKLTRDTSLDWRSTERSPRSDMANLPRDARFGFRLLIKRPAFAAVAILTIALGIAANSAIFSVIYGTYLAPPVSRCGSARDDLDASRKRIT